MIRRLALLFLLVFALFQGRAQVFTSCPENIGFESGTFNNWECYRGLLEVTGEKSNNTVITPNISVSPTKPINCLHALIKNTGKKDLYGNFTLKAPNGSNTIIK
jgi:hypothetical protein